LRGVTKRFRDFWLRPRITALSGLDLVVERGEILGLLGPNGSGKSTTIKILLGLLFPSAGTVEVLGRPPGDVGVKAKIGFLPEETSLYPFLNARETLDFFGRLFGLGPSERRRRIDELLEMIGLSQVGHRPIGEFSKGMTRRIGLAQALINEPELILLDEPTSGLDPIGTREMKDMILRLKDEGKTIVMCSHLLADVQDVCDRIAILHQGELKELGRVDNLLTVADVTQIRAKRLSPDCQNEIRQVIERHHGELVSVEHPTTTLEELFLSIVRDSEARPGRHVSQPVGNGAPPS